MNETPQEYSNRMLGLVTDQDPLKIQAATPKKIERLIKGAAASRLRKRPAPGKWSVVEILTHIADTEIALGWRIRQVLSSPGISLQGFDQDAWAASGRYEKRSAAKSLAQFRALREANLALLKSLTPDEWKRHGMHVERGHESLAHIVRMTAGHDINHLGQIERIIRS